MKILVKTPFYKKNKYLPHLVEHCVLFSPEIDDFLRYYQDIYAYTVTGYTVFEFDNAISWKSVIKRLQSTITPKVIKTQKESLKAEYKDTTHGQELNERIHQKIMQDKTIQSTTIPMIKNEEVAAYHKKRYKEENMIVYDEVGHRILPRGGGKKLKKDPKIGLRSQILSSKISFQKDAYDLIFTRYSSPYDILLIDFFESIATASMFHTTTMKGDHYDDVIDISLTDELYILTIDQGELAERISKDFFEKFKKYYLEQIGHGRMRTFIPHVALLTGYFISVPQHKRFIQAIELKDMETILQLIRTKAPNNKKNT